MIPRVRKHLVEADFPIFVVSKYAEMEGAF